MERWWTQEIFGSLASNLLCDTFRVNVMPNCNHCAWSPAIWAFKIVSISSLSWYMCGTILCGYVMPLESFPAMCMNTCLQESLHTLCPCSNALRQMEHVSSIPSNTVGTTSRSC